MNLNMPSSISNANDNHHANIPPAPKKSNSSSSFSTTSSISQTDSLSQHDSSSKPAINHPDTLSWVMLHDNSFGRPIPANIEYIYAGEELSATQLAQSSVLVELGEDCSIKNLQVLSNDSEIISYQLSQYELPQGEYEDTESGTVLHIQGFFPKAVNEFRRQQVLKQNSLSKSFAEVLEEYSFRNGIIRTLIQEAAQNGLFPQLEIKELSSADDSPLPLPLVSNTISPVMEPQSPSAKFLEKIRFLAISETPTHSSPSPTEDNFDEDLFLLGLDRPSKISSTPPRSPNSKHCTTPVSQRYCNPLVSPYKGEGKKYGSGVKRSLFPEEQLSVAIPPFKNINNLKLPFETPHAQPQYESGPLHMPSPRQPIAPLLAHYEDSPRFTTNSNLAK